MIFHFFLYNNISPIIISIEITNIKTINFVASITVLLGFNGCLGSGFVIIFGFIKYNETELE